MTVVHERVDHAQRIEHFLLQRASVRLSGNRLYDRRQQEVVRIAVVKPLARGEERIAVPGDTLEQRAVRDAVRHPAAPLVPVVRIRNARPLLEKVCYSDLRV